MGAVDDRKHWVVLGQLTRPHGVHGAVRARWYSPLADLTGPLVEVRLRRGDVVATFALAASRTLDTTASLLRLAGVDSPEAAGVWRGATIEVPRALVPPAGDDEVYLFELLGRTVRTVDGRTLGTTTRLYDYGAGPVLGIAPVAAPQQVAPTLRDDGATLTAQATPPDVADLENRTVAVDATQVRAVEHVTAATGAQPSDVPGDAAQNAAAPRHTGRRGRRKRHRVAQEAREELLVPLLAGVLREVDDAGEVVLDLSAARLEV